MAETQVELPITPLNESQDGEFCSESIISECYVADESSISSSSGCSPSLSRHKILTSQEKSSKKIEQNSDTNTKICENPSSSDGFSSQSSAFSSPVISKKKVTTDSTSYSSLLSSNNPSMHSAVDADQPAIDLYHQNRNQDENSHPHNEVEEKAQTIYSTKIAEIIDEDINIDIDTCMLEMLNNASELSSLSRDTMSRRRRSRGKTPPRFVNKLAQMVHKQTRNNTIEIPLIRDTRNVRVENGNFDGIIRDLDHSPTPLGRKLFPKNDHFDEVSWNGSCTSSPSLSWTHLNVSHRPEPMPVPVKTMISSSAQTTPLMGYGYQNGNSSKNQNGYGSPQMDARWNWRSNVTRGPLAEVNIIGQKESKPRPTTLSSATSTPTPLRLKAIRQTSNHPPSPSTPHHHHHLVLGQVSASNDGYFFHSEADSPLSPVGTHSSTSSSLSSATSSLSSGVNGYFFHKNNERVIANGFQSTPFRGLMLENPLVKKMEKEENNNNISSNYSSLITMQKSPFLKEKFSTSHNSAFNNYSEYKPPNFRPLTKPDVTTNFYSTSQTSLQNPQELVDLQNVRAMEAIKETCVVRLAQLFERNSDLKMKNWKKNLDVMQNLRKFVKAVKAKGQSVADTNPPVSSRALFGMPLALVQASRTDGSPLPKCIFDIMEFLLKNAKIAEGVFRKNGVKVRIQQIKEACSQLGVNDSIPSEFLDENQLHDLADVLKQYFRSLPEALLTDRLSETLANVMTDLPEQKRFAALHYCILLLPGENRDALLNLLFFLKKIASFSDLNHMSPENLAICMMPSLFRMPTGLGPVTGLRRRKTISMPSDRERTEYHSMKQSLMMLIEECDRLVKLPKEIAAEIDFSMNTVELQMPFGNGLTLSPNSPSLGVLVRMCSQVLEDYDLNWKDWKIERTSMPGVQVFTKEPIDKVPLKHYHTQITIAIRPRDLFKVLLNNREAWDTGMYSAQKIISATHLNFEVQQVKYKTLNAEILKQCFLARTWRDPDISTNCYVLAERSICGLHTQNGLNRPLDPSNRINVLQSIFLIVPVSGMSELHYFSRIDLKGKTPAWYQNVFAERLASQMYRLRENVLAQFGAPFGPETHL